MDMRLLQHCWANRRALTLPPPPDRPILCTAAGPGLGSMGDNTLHRLIRASNVSSTLARMLHSFACPTDHCCAAQHPPQHLDRTRC